MLKKGSWNVTFSWLNSWVYGKELHTYHRLTAQLIEHKSQFKMVALVSGTFMYLSMVENN